MSSETDYENGTDDHSTGGIANERLDEEFGDGPVHDQLPSVEEYKTNVQGSGQTPRSENGTSPTQSLHYASKKDVESHYDEDQSSSYAQDQLPSVEEYRAATGITAGDDTWGILYYFAIFVGLVVVTVAIVVPVVLNQDTSSSLRTDPSSPTPAPITAPTEPPLQREERIKSYLVDLGISSEESLTTDGTPQNKALTWLAFDDELRMDIPSSSKQHSRFVERYVLAVFYHATNGPSWIYKMKFLSGIDHCEWFDNFLDNSGDRLKLGVAECRSTAESETTTGGSMVTQLSFPMNEVGGSFPLEIQYLRRLESIFIPFNPKLGGDLSFGLTELVELSSFEAQYCTFTGNIPSDIGNLKKLTSLGLGNNNLKGQLPGSFFELTDLEMLGLDDNLFEISLPSLARLGKLKQAYLEDNTFTGGLTEELATAWSYQLEELDLSGNKISSTIPASFLSLPNLVVMDLHGNNFRGSIPEITATNTVLQFLALHENALTGQIPESIRNLNNLRHLDLAKNKLETPLPDTLGELTGLEYLFMGQNDFSFHEIPDFLWSLTSLRELSMKNNSLTGTIPSEIRTLEFLQLLDLDGNRLTGKIPDEIGLLDGLDYLLLNRNRLSGTIPSTFTLLYDLKMLLIDHNKINGTADVICGDQKIELKYFVADCEGPIVNINCTCCDLCCNDLNATCNNLGWHVNLDPIWEYGFARNSYQFSSEIVASEP